MEITQVNIEGQKCPSNLLVSLKTLLTNLKHWNTEKDVSITRYFKKYCSLMIF